MFKRYTRVMVWIFMPLLFLFIGYGLMYVIAQPYIRPFTSIYSMISQDQAPDFSNKTNTLYTKGDSLPESGILKASEIASVSMGDVIGRVVLEDVNIDVPFIYGASVDCLYNGVGLRVQSSKPGYGKPVMIAGHTIPYFKNLGLVEVGQIVRVETYYGIFKYRITGTKIANEADQSAYNLKQNKEQLILFTCYPLDGVGDKDDRLLVYADKISGPVVKE